MESLFARPTPKRGRVSLMLAGSLLLHGGIVGFAAMWRTPAPLPPVAEPAVEVVVDPPTGGPETVNMVEPATTPMETAVSLEPVDATQATSPPTETEPEFAEPPTTPPPRRMAASRPVTATRSSNAPPDTRVAGPGQPGGPSGNRVAGPGTGASANVNAWFMPHPPYPRNLLASRSTDATTVRITTDASGRISNVEVTRSTGNPALDFHTVSYVRSNWHGPPNASRMAEFVYETK